MRYGIVDHITIGIREAEVVFKKIDVRHDVRTGGAVFIYVPKHD